jgi:glyceraldehyde-3-phosphate dehydrogenase/erythrose-4-phosphate dehydrogenase
MKRDIVGKLKVAINGFGCIGRNFLLALLAWPQGATS